MKSVPASTGQGWRARFMMGVVLGLWLIVTARLVHLQIFQADKLSAVAQKQHELEVEIPARPADLVDRNGKLLATTIVTHSLFVDPSRLSVDPTFIETLAKIVRLDAEALKLRLANAAGKRFLWVKRRLDVDEMDKISELDWPPGSYGFREEFLRQYPQGRLAAHVLGLRDIDGIGRGGVEQSLDHLVQGEPGRRRLVRDAMGRIVEINFDPNHEPRRFDAVRLTIDLGVQTFAEKALDGVIRKWQPKAASAIVIDPISGEILAMASRPTYSPNDLSNVPEDAWKNQAINIVYEPGSTFKPFIVAWGLQEKAIERDDIFDCENGKYRMGPRVLSDHHAYSKLSVTDILVKSSNIGMAKIGERLTNEELYRATLAFGFGRPTGIDLPGELSGLLQPLDKWNIYSTGSIPMGHELAVTPLQLITAHSALANGGRLITPRILKGVQGRGHDSAKTFQASLDEPGLAVAPRIVTQTVPSDVARWVVEEPMVAVVARGTGRNAQLPGYSVFGKTGTAQKIDPATGKYSEELHTSSFLCGAPATDPRVLVLVVVDEPQSDANHYGGTIAAPAAAWILNRTLLYLGVPPDQDVRSARR